MICRQVNNGGKYGQERKFTNFSQKISTQHFTVLTIYVILQIEQKKREINDITSGVLETINVTPRISPTVRIQHVNVSFERRYDL